MTFLPNDYEVPKTGGKFLKFEEGKTKLRVLSSAVVGYEYWNQQNKPVRSKEPINGTPVDIRLDKEGNPTRIKHFWAFVVWNYNEEKVQLAHITQSTIQEAIKAYVDEEDWGDPKEYDLVITRTGEGFDTKYSVIANPKKPLPKEAKEAYENESIDLKKVFEGENPFGSEPSDEVDPDDEVDINDIPE